MPTTDEQLAFLMQFDNDNINCCRITQKLMQDLILKLAKKIDTRAERSKNYLMLLNSYKAILQNKNLTAGWRAKILTIPKKDSIFSISTRIRYGFS